MTPKQKTLAMIVSGALVAVAPSFFGYLQARQEIREKYNQNRAASEAGYTTLVESVEALQKNASAQHEYTIKLEAQVVVLTDLISKMRVRVSGTRPVPPGTGSGSGVAVADPAPLPKMDKPPDRPVFKRPPPDLNAAQHPERPTLP